jgi:hypothetical protein
MVAERRGRRSGPWGHQDPTVKAGAGVGVCKPKRKDSPSLLSVFPGSSQAFSSPLGKKKNYNKKLQKSEGPESAFCSRMFTVVTCTVIKTRSPQMLEMTAGQFQASPGKS